MKKLIALLMVIGLLLPNFAMATDKVTEQQAERSLGPQSENFGSDQEAKALLELIKAYPHKPSYCIKYFRGYGSLTMEQIMNPQRDKTWAEDIELTWFVEEEKLFRYHHLMYYG
jgi:hypothetical protein